MIKKNELLNNQSKALKAAIENIDFVIGSMYDLQILVSTDLNNQLDALIMQGGILDEVNQERTESGLHKLTSLTNEKIVLSEWTDLIKKGEGIVFCFLMDHGRQRMNSRFKLAIDMTNEAFPDVRFDVNNAVKGDYLLCYIGQDLKEEKAPEKAPETPKTTKKKTTTRKKKS
jgi:hypothetical protein